MEFSLGTGPNESTTLPDQADLPEVEFVTALSSATEGGETHTIAFKVTPSYVGTIYYSVSARSSTVAGSDFLTLSGEATALGTTGIISLDLIDDLIITKERLLLLNLSTNPPGNDYRASGAVTHVVALKDNDSY